MGEAAGVLRLGQRFTFYQHSEVKWFADPFYLEDILKTMRYFCVGLQSKMTIKYIEV